MAALPPSGGGTMVSLPSRLPSTGSEAGGAANSSAVAAAAAALDPESLLDSLGDFSAGSRYAATNLTVAGKGDAGGEAAAEAKKEEHDFDPIEFLNQHYHTEQQLVTALPSLRSAISSRLDRLDENLSTTLRHQAALAPTLARDVVDARRAALQLASRIKQVQERAQQSEAAVLEITRDMKRLDFAKRHLQRTITALKRLHMLLHAAEQLRTAAQVTPQQPVPHYQSAAHLVDATRLLLGHFEGYMQSVPKMRQVRDAVGVIKGQLWEGIVTLFRELGNEEQRMKDEMRQAAGEGGMEGGGMESGESNHQLPVQPPSSMVQKTLADACLVVEALGPKSMEQFIADFIKDHLEEYEELYNPSPAALAKKKGGGDKSFKKSESSLSATGGDATLKPGSIDTVENRFAWYRSKLRYLQLQFAHVFPPQWNVHYRLTAKFLEMTARHLKFVLKKNYNKNKVRIPPFNAGGGSASGSTAGVSMASAAASKFGSMSVSTHGNKSSHGSGPDGENLSEGEKAVTALLKALQKTILFEKEMSAWLTRDFGTKFADPAAQTSGETSKENEEADGGDNDLEFDEHGRAVAAKSAEGIKIKYERRKRAGGFKAAAPVQATGGPVPPLSGIASATFDEHMSPYVALEERSMDEQLHAAAADSTVDNRGERPVFVSSTNLFIYQKNSITRCTALTREKTFFLLQRAFQKKLRGYAGILEKKLPPPLSQAMAKMALAAGVGHASSTQAAQQVYRIPPGEEVTICHVIDTCEYCADTVEALEDLIRDKIGDKYKDKIDMSEEQGAFQDVTAKSIRVLVSGLENRLDAPLKEISRTNWATFDMVGEESSYVRTIHLTVHPFVVQVRELIPSSYFRSFCDKFALLFAATYYRTLVGLKRISEAGTQQLLLDVYSIKTLLLKLPVLEAEKKTALGSGSTRHVNPANLSGGSTIAPAMYTKQVNREFRKLEVMLKLVGSPKEMLVDMFRAQWDCSMDTASMASDFTTVMTLKGIPRTEHAAMLESLGVEAAEASAAAGADSTIQALQDRGSDVAAKVNADLNVMRQRVDDFRRAFR
ncbi:hypothetical protein ACHAXT_006333 [Thalassiosira profunda]